MATEADLVLHYSGGASNDDPAASLGGAIGDQVPDQQVSGLSIAGVTVLGGRGLSPKSHLGGTQQLRYLVGPPKTLSFVGFEASGAFGTPVVIDGDGVYAIPQDVAFANNEGRRLIVSVTEGTLPVSDTTDSSTTEYVGDAGHLFDDLTDAEQVAGDVEYRCLYLRNSHGGDTLKSVRAYLAAAPQGASGPEVDVFALGLDPAGVGDGTSTGVATTVGDEETAPAGVTFSAPTHAAPLAVGELAAGEVQAVWVRRTAPVDLGAGNIDVMGLIGIEMEIL